MESAAARGVSYQRLLVPLDGSPEAEAALPHAAAHARAFGASIALVRVVQGAQGTQGVTLELPAEAGMAPLGTGAEFSENGEALGASIYLEEVARRLRAEGIPTASAVREGPVAATILAEAAASQAGLIVISTHVPTGLARLVLGSVADELLRGAPCPVLHVREERPLNPDVPAPQRVRSFAADMALAGPVTPVSLGLREVPVDRIVGSVGRARELGRNFLPLEARRRDDPRFKNIRTLMADGKALPPAQLYKLGYNYYVLDGHHRVAAARDLGVHELEAEVTEYLSTSDDVQRRAFNERRQFERQTGLTRVGAARLETYRALLEMIKEYAETQRSHAPVRSPERPAGSADGTATTPASPTHLGPSLLKDDAEALRDMARRWFYTFFQPMAQRIRAKGLGTHFPLERTADILVRLRDFRAEEARLGHEVSWEAALEHFAAAYSRSQERRPWDLRRLVRLKRR